MAIRLPRKGNDESRPTTEDVRSAMPDLAGGVPGPQVGTVPPPGGGPGPGKVGAPPPAAGSATTRSPGTDAPAGTTSPGTDAPAGTTSPDMDIPEGSVSPRTIPPAAPASRGSNRGTGATASEARPASAPGPQTPPGSGLPVGPDDRPLESDAEPLPGYGTDTLPGQWLPDLLGPGFSYTTLPLADDDEGPVSATLVRFQPVPDPTPEEPEAGGIARLRGPATRLWERLQRPVRTGVPEPADVTAPAAPPPPVPVVLVVHGWTDYFYNAELARYWSDRGYRFYALDLRRYGRSLRTWQTPGFVGDLAEYDADIESALAAIAVDVGARPAVVCQAHSTGGLVMALWANRNPGRLQALVLNSPWLEMQGSSIVRYAAAGLLDPVARLRPKTRLKLPEADHYWQSLSRDGHGEWDLHPLWRPRYAFPLTAGWITAVLAGHAAVAKGLDIQEPVLVLTSARTHIAVQFEREMLEADSVIEVEVVRQRAVRLGREVTVVSIEKGMHDLFTSGAEARHAAYGALSRWADGYLAGLGREGR